MKQRVYVEHGNPGKFGKYSNCLRVSRYFVRLRYFLLPIVLFVDAIEWMLIFLITYRISVVDILRPVCSASYNFIIICRYIFENFMNLYKILAYKLYKI